MEHPVSPGTSGNGPSLGDVLQPCRVDLSQFNISVPSSRAPLATGTGCSVLSGLTVRGYCFCKSKE